LDSRRPLTAAGTATVSFDFADGNAIGRVVGRVVARATGRVVGRVATRAAGRGVGFAIRRAAGCGVGFAIRRAAGLFTDPPARIAGRVVERPAPADAMANHPTSTRRTAGLSLFIGKLPARLYTP